MNLKRKQQPGPAAVAAAEWWADATGHPVHRITDENSGRDDQRLGGEFAMFAALAVSRMEPVTSERAQAFVNDLAARVQGLLDRYAKLNLSDPSVTLSVDYGPDGVLADAAQKAGIGGLQFPSKSCMWVYPDHVTVSAGYRAATRLVWASDEWQANRPTCRSQEWRESEFRDEEPRYGGEPFRCSLPLYHEEPCRYDRPISLCSACGSTEDRITHDQDSHHPARHEFEALPAGQRFELSRGPQ